MTVFLLACQSAATAQVSANPQAREVQQTVRKYLETIYDGRAGEAWLLHTRESITGESFDDFDQVVRVAATLKGRVTIERIGEPQIDGDRATVEAVQRLESRTSTYRFTLLREDGQWRIHNPPQGPGTQPRAPRK